MRSWNPSPAPFAREVLIQAAADGKPVALIMDQSKLSDRHQVLMLAVRCGERALPLAWRVETTEGGIGFETQKELLEAVAPWLPRDASVMLLGDRFDGTPDLITWCRDHGWDYRLRLKGNLVVVYGGAKTTTGACADAGIFRLEDVALTAKRVRTNIGIIRDPARSGPRRAMGHRHVRSARLPADLGLFPALGHRADVLRFQEPRLRHRGHTDPL